MSIACWVVDDEQAAHDGIQLALQRHDDFEVVFHAYDLTGALEKQAQRPDVIFLDIEMPGESGLKFFELWQSELPLVIFVTAYQQFALQAFEHNALDYLLKPIEQRRFDDMLNRVRQRLTEKQSFNKRHVLDALMRKVKQQGSALGITVKTDEGLFRLQQKHLIMLESVAEHVVLYYQDKQLIVRDSLKRLGGELDQEFFFRTHKSFIVNKSHFQKLEKNRFGDGVLFLTGGHCARLSRRYKEVLKSLSQS